MDTNTQPTISPDPKEDLAHTIVGGRAFGVGSIQDARNLIAMGAVFVDGDQVTNCWVETKPGWVSIRVGRVLLERSRT